MTFSTQIRGSRGIIESLFKIFVKIMPYAATTQK